MEEIDVNRYSQEQMDTLLLSYEGLVQELPELAAAWGEMDAMERDHHLANFGQAWGHRRLLGVLFRAGKLTEPQEARLEQLDRQLFEQSRLVYTCYKLDARRLMKLFVWGTPLVLSRQALRVEFDPSSLNEMALAWAGA
jgi:hypothetical protein